MPYEDFILEPVLSILDRSLGIDSWMCSSNDSLPTLPQTFGDNFVLYWMIKFWFRKYNLICMNLCGKELFNEKDFREHLSKENFVNLNSMIIFEFCIIWNMKILPNFVAKFD